MLWGQVRFNGPSRFIDEIPEEYFEWKSIGKPGKTSRSSNSDFDFDDDFSQESTVRSNTSVSYIQSNPKVDIKYPAGSKVQHKIYGAGQVKKSEGFGPDEKVTIKFTDGSLKKFMVKFAPLEKI